MTLVGAVVLFGIFAINVALGSFGGLVVLGDVGEMLVLFAASIFFVAEILKRETARKKDNDGGQ